MNCGWTWEAAVQWLRFHPAHRGLALSCYYDDPLISAARRFCDSSEWTACRELLADRLPADVLDLGAGRGIASYAFARERCTVTALEPDDSEIVGRRAIAQLAEQAGLAIQAVAGHGEQIPFANHSFDIVYARAVLHHARDLSQLCREAARVLRSGGAFLAVREHVITRSDDLSAFQESHPLHRLYGGEHAYRRSEYEAAIASAGLRLKLVLGPYDSPINFWPLTTEEIKGRLANRVARRVGGPLASWMVEAVWRRRLLRSMLSRLNGTPGRHYSFLGIKP